jgi:hypothetical protein
MAEFVYTTATSMPGPWLIDSDQLESLDKILDDEWVRITKHHEDSIRKKVDKMIEENEAKGANILYENPKKAFDERVRAFDGKDERNVTIRLKANKKIIVKSFGEALRQQDLLQEMPIGFSAVMKSGDISGEIALTGRGHLEISVSPERLSESKEFFAALQRWASKIRPPKWQQYWLAVEHFQWFLWVLILVVALSIVGNSDSTAKKFYKQQAAELLKDGLSEDEHLKAIETILALESGYVPPGQGVANPGWFKILLFGGFIACVVLSIRPKSRIGIGKGQDSINRWRLWMRVVFVIIPGFIFVNIVWPYLGKFLPGLF